ncbi:MAG TPA: hypothetical protein VIH04_02415 [Nitrosarchaeum sp.]
MKSIILIDFTMKALYKKETLKDPESENNTYSNFTLKRDAEFCCEKFKNFCKKFTVWNYEQGKFAIVDQITYDGHSVQSIDFCPFCGEKIDYEDENAPQKVKKKKVRTF